ncbi:MAG TPA: SIMPL domain-containing protein [Solirubrobacteraceae bacterium]|nr:SIMPL domain-containing protein [Solirubrobacteraceae bacterium]
MKAIGAVMGVVAVALVGASVLGVAGAETTTTASPPATPPPRTVSVTGAAEAPVEPTASAASADAAYRQAMAAAIADGQSKAQFLAEKVGATVGQVQSVGEGSGSLQCPGEEEFTGTRPDFGSGGGVSFAAPAARVTMRRAPARKPRAKKRHALAHKSAVEPCTVSAQVALVYLLS